MEILTLLGFVSLAWFWVDSMRAREAATRAGKRICEQEGVQFLDDTVAIAKLKLVRNRGGRLALRRIYRFEFSDTGDNRKQGSVEVLAGTAESAVLEPFRFDEHPGRR